MPEDDEYKRQKLKDNFEQPLAKRNFWNRQRDVKGSISFKCFYLTEVCRNVKLKKTIIKCILNIKIINLCLILARAPFLRRSVAWNSVDLLMVRYSQRCDANGTPRCGIDNQISSACND